MTNYELFQLERYGDILTEPVFLPDGTVQATEAEVERFSEYKHYYTPDRPEGWQYIPEPVPSFDEQRKEAWRRFKEMQDSQPKIDHTGYHGNINQSWFDREVNKDIL